MLRHQDTSAASGTSVSSNIIPEVLIGYLVSAPDDSYEPSGWKMTVTAKPSGDTSALSDCRAEAMELCETLLKRRQLATYERPSKMAMIVECGGLKGSVQRLTRVLSGKHPTVSVSYTSNESTLAEIWKKSSGATYRQPPPTEADINLRLSSLPVGGFNWKVDESPS